VPLAFSERGNSTKRRFLGPTRQKRKCGSIRCHLSVIISSRQP